MYFFQDMESDTFKIRLILHKNSLNLHLSETQTTTTTITLGWVLLERKVFVA